MLDVTIISHDNRTDLQHHNGQVNHVWKANFHFVLCFSDNCEREHDTIPKLFMQINRQGKYFMFVVIRFPLKFLFMKRDPHSASTFIALLTC